MNKKRWMVLGGVLAALVVSVALGAQAVFAEAATPPAPPDDRGAPPDGHGVPPGGQPGMRRLGPVELGAAAGALGMTTDELSAELESGTTLADLATKKGVEIEAVRAAIQAAHKQTMLESINQAAADGKMTQDKADWLIVGLEKGYLDGPGFGFVPGMGFGGPPGRRGPLSEATQQP